MSYVLLILVRHWQVGLIYLRANCMVHIPLVANRKPKTSVWLQSMAKAFSFFPFILDQATLASQYQMTVCVLTSSLINNLNIEHGNH